MSNKLKLHASSFLINFASKNPQLHQRTRNTHQRMAGQKTALKKDHGVSSSVKDATKSITQRNASASSSKPDSQKQQEEEDEDEVEEFDLEEDDGDDSENDSDASDSSDIDDIPGMCT